MLASGRISKSSSMRDPVARESESWNPDDWSRSRATAGSATERALLEGLEVGPRTFLRTRGGFEAAVWSIILRWVALAGGDKRERRTELREGSSLEPVCKRHQIQSIHPRALQKVLHMFSQSLGARPAAAFRIRHSAMSVTASSLCKASRAYPAARRWRRGTPSAPASLLRYRRQTAGTAWREKGTR